jgi:hypothetical protein
MIASLGQRDMVAVDNPLPPWRVGAVPILQSESEMMKGSRAEMRKG